MNLNIKHDQLKAWIDGQTQKSSLIAVLQRHEKAWLHDTGALDTEKLAQYVDQLVLSLLVSDGIYTAIQDHTQQFCQINGLSEQEASVVMDALLVSLMSSVIAKKPNIQTTQQLIKRLLQCDVALLNALVRKSCGYSATDNHSQVLQWLSSQQGGFIPILRFAPEDRAMVLRFDPDQAHLSMIHDAVQHQTYVEQCLHKTNTTYAIGLYGENRGCYQSDIFDSPGSDDRRSVHLGLDVFTQGQTQVYAPMDGEVMSLTYNAGELDYGYTVILRHQIPQTTVVFYTLYGHLSQRTTDLIQPGELIKAGQGFAYLGDHHENGGWSPHLHFQIITDMLSCEGDFYGACEASMWPLWQQICPDPALMASALTRQLNAVSG